ncbi:type I-E CRISPR-associated endoribonuclease Cas2e [Streptomyces sp. NPDC058171]
MTPRPRTTKGPGPYGTHHAEDATVVEQAVPDHVRGALTRWMIEPTPGLYVGTISARVRDELWSVIRASIGPGVATLIHLAANGQGFELHAAGDRRRIPVDFDGLTLMDFIASELDDTSGNQEPHAREPRLRWTPCVVRRPWRS